MNIDTPCQCPETLLLGFSDLESLPPPINSLSTFHSLRALLLELVSTVTDACWRDAGWCAGKNTAPLVSWDTRTEVPLHVVWTLRASVRSLTSSTQWKL